MKKCIGCGHEFSLDHFPSIDRKGKIEYRPRCLPCHREMRMIKYHELSKKILEIKKRQGPCTKCGFSDTRALDFHHPNPTDKDFSISRAPAAGYSIKRIEAEMDKCVVLCANCHRIEHHESK